MLQYVPDVEERQGLVTEMARLVRPGGSVVFCGSGNGLYPGGPHSSLWWSNLLPKKAARPGHNRGVTYWEFNRMLKPLGFAIVPQGNASIERWLNRKPNGRRSLKSRVAAAGFRTIGAILKPLGPSEAFLPYPDLAFRKLDGIEPADRRSMNAKPDAVRLDTS